MSDHTFLVSEIKRWKAERDDLRRRLGRLRRLTEKLLRMNIIRPKCTRGYINIADALDWHDDSRSLLVEIESALAGKPPMKRRGTQ